MKHEVLSMMNDTEYVRTQEGRRQEMAREAELELEVGKKEPYRYGCGSKQLCPGGGGVGGWPA